ncbi:hypothetical protein C463_14565 [Halorubrum californiense DSM 19288]|uniref:DUF7509 domain-containing protein n=1 Tax=Halorubrum californiense DSM 19288 TaxID=1227465 RepID=M0E194_9EURY|nr:MULTISPECIES: hypothetical protein [Halorubrum]ELZ40823.1 hypothetical protein C463_14565 [Halorubrum californiense DSM 19288]TKX73012.1 hypothetical protein EXE40_01680 [Halorubrum sp. GN11GM_10-3_MGM]
MRQRIIDNLPRAAGDSDALTPVRREQFLVYLMGPYRTFDVDALLPADANVETDAPSFATWDETSGEYAEDEVLRLLQETRDCLRDRGFNAFLAIDVGIPLEEMDAATQSIAFAQASNATVFIAPQVGDNLGVGIEIGSVLEDLLPTDEMQGSAADATSPERARRVMVATEPSVRSAMLGAVHARWDASVRTFTDAVDCCQLCAQFCTHIQNGELYGSLDRLD